MKHILVLGLLAAMPPPALAQIPCDNSNTINCEHHPEHGWIIRGSAPRKENPSPKPAEPAVDAYANQRELIDTRPKEGTCEFASGGAGFVTKWGRMTEQQRVATLVQGEEACLGRGELTQCWLAAQDNTYFPSPPANPTKAHQLIAKACAIEGAGTMFNACRHLREHCIPGTPMAIAGAVPVYVGSAAAPPPPQPPRPSARDRPMLQEPCSFTDVSPLHVSDRNDGTPPATQLKVLRARERGCLEFREAYDCSKAALDHGLLKIPEANPKKARYFFALACEYNSNQCQWAEQTCGRPIR